MEIIQAMDDPNTKEEVFTLSPGTVVKSKDSRELYLVCRDGRLIDTGKSALVNLRTGTSFAVPKDTSYEVVEATLTWRHHRY